MKTTLSSTNTPKFLNDTNNYSESYQNCQGDSLSFLGEKRELKRKLRKNCPHCGHSIGIERLTPDKEAFGEVVCSDCHHHLTYVSPEKSLLNLDGTKKRLKIVAIPFKERIGRGFFRIIDSNGVILADQLSDYSEADYYFECREEVKNV